MFGDNTTPAASVIQAAAREPGTSPGLAGISGFPSAEGRAGLLEPGNPAPTPWLTLPEATEPPEQRQVWAWSPGSPPCSAYTPSLCPLGPGWVDIGCRGQGSRAFCVQLGPSLTGLST